MSFKDLELKKSYISCGEESISKSFIEPTLKEAVLYKRSVGFFSSSVFETITEGIVGLVKNNGKIQLISSPNLSQEDIHAIKLGYGIKEEIIKNSFSSTFKNEIEKLDDFNLKLLVELISKDFLDIKIAVPELLGIYHDKLGVLEDSAGNKIAFFGSSNASLGGYQNNYEKIRIARSWVVGEDDTVKDELEEFDALWNSKNEHVVVYEFKESAKKHIINVIENRKGQKQNKEPIVLRDYQREAIDAWVANNYKGFYVMATGTGKTWTAIYSAKELLNKHEAMIVICAPYKHLVKQWCEDVEKIFSDAKIILVSSENPYWEQQISTAIINKKYNPQSNIIIISTIASFDKEKFESVIKKYKGEKLLIVDEAHRFTKRSEQLKDEYKYMLGLSATPFNGSSVTTGKELMEFFGGQVFSLPIEVALEKGFLVKYSYHPIYVSATEDEESKFVYHTQQMMACFKNDICIDSEKLAKEKRARLRVVAMSSEKMENIDDIIDKIENKDHFVVYCGDGRSFDEDTGEELRHIQSIKNVLTKHNYKTSQFTAKEKMKERMQLVDMFNKGDITTLVAIRCLDEGINIPSIKSALILASNDDYREFVQRRGRILRTYKNKKVAKIYDVIVLPSSDLTTWAKIELRRFYEYAKLATNWDEELQLKLQLLLDDYNISIEDIDVYDYEEMERELDE